jgi:hypothetical protein
VNQGSYCVRGNRAEAYFGRVISSFRPDGCFKVLSVHGWNSSRLERPEHLTEANEDECVPIGDSGSHLSLKRTINLLKSKFEKQVKLLETEKQKAEDKLDHQKLKKKNKKTV